MRRRPCNDCGKICHGLRCRECNSKTSLKWRLKGEAQRHYHLQQKYGMGVDEFESWWYVFQGKCGICNNNMTRPVKKQGQPLTCVSVDHDHETGIVRGLLCSGCNKGLGMFKDNVINLEKAIGWLNGT